MSKETDLVLDAIDMGLRQRHYPMALLLGFQQDAVVLEAVDL
jgi:hypothetical protein